MSPTTTKATKSYASSTISRLNGRLEIKFMKASKRMRRLPNPKVKCSLVRSAAKKITASSISLCPSAICVELRNYAQTLNALSLMSFSFVHAVTTGINHMKKWN